MVHLLYTQLRFPGPVSRRRCQRTAGCGPVSETRGQPFPLHTATSISSSSGLPLPITGLGDHLGVTPSSCKTLMTRIVGVIVCCSTLATATDSLHNHLEAVTTSWQIYVRLLVKHKSYPEYWSVEALISGRRGTSSLIRAWRPSTTARVELGTMLIDRSTR
jgi:hypothetical protein